MLARDATHNRTPARSPHPARLASNAATQSLARAHSAHSCEPQDNQQKGRTEGDVPFPQVAFGSASPSQPDVFSANSPPTHPTRIRTNAFKRNRILGANGKYFNQIQRKRGKPLFRDRLGRDAVTGRSPSRLPTHLPCMSVCVWTNWNAFARKRKPSAHGKYTSRIQSAQSKDVRRTEPTHGANAIPTPR